MYCPVCGTCDIGKVATNQYYCWNCLLEFSDKGNQFHIYYVEADGSLVDVKEKQDKVEVEI
ncbi:MAG TPA: hypothetical protein GX697_05300 [Firmicutes bacterium]|nr:hypothetical protein [Bacillota bacterium]